MDDEVSCESWRINSKIAVDTGCRECSRDRGNSWWSGEQLIYQEER